MSGRLGQFYALVLLLACLVTNIAFFAEVREPFLGDDDPMASVKLALSELNIQARIAELSSKILSNAEEAETDKAAAGAGAGEVPPATLPPTPLPWEVERPAPRAEPLPQREPRQQATPQPQQPMPQQPTPQQATRQQPMPQQATPPVNNLPVIAEPIVDPFSSVDPFQPFGQPPRELPPRELPLRELPPRGLAEPAPAISSPFSAPLPATAVVQPVIADQFSPIGNASQPVASQPIVPQPVASQPPASQPTVPQPTVPEPVVPQPTAPVRPSSTPVWGTIDTILARPIRYD